jgi:ABC-2 type transport system ATP-binding protein
MGLIPLKNGKVSMLGENLPKGRTIAVEQIGAVVENPTFIETMTGAENLKWFGSLYKPIGPERIEEVILTVGLKDAGKVRFGNYSSGMKQRLGVAFGILHKPRLLVLDEPTSGMDPAGRVQMREILQKIHREEQTTIFLSSHLLDEIQRLCDYVVIIDEGTTVQEGYVKDILSNHQETWEIRIADEAVKSAENLLEQYKTRDLTWDVGPRGLIITMPQGMAAEINKSFVKADIEVQALIPREASLEETFIKLTEKKGEAR